MVFEDDVKGTRFWWGKDLCSASGLVALTMPPSVARCGIGSGQGVGMTLSATIGMVTVVVGAASLSALHEAVVVRVVDEAVLVILQPLRGSCVEEMVEVLVIRRVRNVVRMVTVTISSVS